MVFLFILVLITAGAWFVYTNYERIMALFANKPTPSRSKRLNDSSGIPFANTFYLYDHNSVEDWTNWMVNEDITKKDLAVNRLTDYLAKPAEDLGVVTPDVVTALVAFERPHNFNHLSHFMGRIRENFDVFKNQVDAYACAANGLTILNPDSAETFLIQEFKAVKDLDDATPLLQGIITAICSLKFNDRVKDLFISTLNGHSIKFEIKKEILDKVEKLDIEVQKEIYILYIEKQLAMNSSKISKDDEQTLEIVLNKVKRYLTSDYDSEIWNLCLKALNKDRLTLPLTNFYCETLSQRDGFSDKQTLELLTRPTPAKKLFIETLGNKFNLSEPEMTLTQPLFDPQDVVYERTRINIERATKGKKIVEAMMNEFKLLEKLAINGLDSKMDKSGSAAIKVLTGKAEKDKVYILRALANYHERSFVTIDIDSFLKSDLEFKSFEQTISNCKPCIVYFDNIDGLLKRELDKNERNKVKEMFRIIRELGNLPTVYFTGNMPFNKSEMGTISKTMQENFSKTTHGHYSQLREIKPPDEKQRKQIFSELQVKIQDSRMMESLTFNIDELIASTETLGTLGYLEYIKDYFEISLLLYGKLIEVEEFKKLNAEKKQLIAKYIDFSDEGSIGAEEFSEESSAVESAV